MQQLKNLFDFEEKDVLQISAKTGLNVDSILDTLIHRIPSPKVSESTSCQALLFDSWYVHHKGAISLVLVRQGKISKGVKIRSIVNERDYEVLEVGVMHPEMIPCQSLYPGQVGYIICNMKSAKEAVIGDILHDPREKNVIQPFKSFKPIKPTVYAGLYPVDVSDYDDLKRSLERLCLNDRSVTLENSTSPVLGQGWRVGFLGVLHMEVFGQRLDQDYDANVILTAPGVEYKADIIDNETVRIKRHNGQAQISICNASQFPEMPQDVKRYLEPMVLVTMVLPNEHLAAVDKLCFEARGEPKEAVSMDENQLLVKWRMPLADVAAHFFESLKRITSGYASFDYEDDGASSKAKKLVQNLKEGIPKQQFEVSIKAVMNTSSKVIAQAVIQPWKKDFTMRVKGNMAGGRILKKLEEQKQGKEKLKLIGKVRIPRETFVDLCGQPFEDIRENFLEYKNYKDKLPLPRLPKLTVDGKLELTYTNVILAYLGRKFGLVPADRLKMVIEQVLIPCCNRDYGPYFEKQLEKNNSGYLVGEALTYVDFFAACFSDFALTYGRVDIFDKFPEFSTTARQF
uniref:Translation factor GUF1 homolog, mitochondrial n=1 Tax=Ditylenchus dipsaci TaxID=166011 RepID=A0A915DLL8_9BILA